jgi:predicted metalloprotease with PDZ domain
MFQKTAGERKRTFVTDLQSSLKIGLLCACLIFIAAMIEAFATPKILAACEKEHLAGIGVQLEIQEHQLAITHVCPGSPASKAGLSSGLLIQKSDGAETTGKDVG